MSPPCTPPYTPGLSGELLEELRCSRRSSFFTSPPSFYVAVLFFKPSPTVDSHRDNVSLRDPFFQLSYTVSPAAIKLLAPSGGLLEHIMTCLPFFPKLPPAFRLKGEVFARITRSSFFLARDGHFMQQFRPLSVAKNDGCRCHSQKSPPQLRHFAVDRLLTLKYPEQNKSFFSSDLTVGDC